MASARGTSADDWVDDVFVRAQMWERGAGFLVEIAGESVVRRVLLWRLMKKRESRDRVETKLRVRTQTVRPLDDKQLDSVVGGAHAHKSTPPDGGG